jgi:DegV family protein with EDD domain
MRLVAFPPAATHLPAMPPVAVVTDTTHYLPRSLADEVGLHQVSLLVGWEDQREREIDMSSYDAFYARLRDDPRTPSTSQPSIGDFLEVWEPLLETGHDLVAIHLAGGISGTVEAARQAADVARERDPGRRIEVIDGETGCGGLGYVALVGALAAREGLSVDEVVARVREGREGLKIWFALDTLEYLQRGGRIGRAQAWLGGALKIKPILSLEYEITPVERVRTSARAFDRLVEFLRERHRDGADGWFLQHIQAPDVAARLADAGREIFHTEPLFISEVGPVIGTYTGPGFMGVAGGPRRLVPGL